MTASNAQSIYCGVSLDDFHTSYKTWHGYVSLVVCILGTIANTLNIIVLSRREMRSPTNAILMGLAVADLAVMIEYMPYTLHDYILGKRLPRAQQLSYAWACFIKFHSIFAQVLHTISIWLTVTLAVWRYIAVGHPQRNRVWCGMRTTHITIVTAYIVCVMVVSPSLYLITAIAEFREVFDVHGQTIDSVPLSPYIIDYKNELRAHNAAEAELGSTIVSTTTLAITTLTSRHFDFSENMTSSRTATSTADGLAMRGRTNTASSDDASYFWNVTVYRLYHSDLALRNKSLLNATFLIYSVLIKLIPCFALTILSIRLIKVLLAAKRRRKMLLCNAANSVKPVIGSKNLPDSILLRKNSKALEKEKQTHRTTRMLLAVLLLFLITEFPQGIMGLLNTVLGDAFFMECYLKLSDLMDILALINSSINFILYCSMSRHFRSTFTLLFKPKFFEQWLLVAQDKDGLNGMNVQLRDVCSGDLARRSGIFGKRQFQTTQVTNV